MPKRKKLYDVYLAHHSADKQVVEALALRLHTAGLSPFLDRWELVPGERWQDGIERALVESRTFAVCLGSAGLGPWTDQELNAALDLAAREPLYLVIPIFLPGADPPDQTELPLFLRSRTWVDLRRGPEDEQAFEALVAAVRASSRRSKRPGDRLREGAIERQTREVIESLQNRFFDSLRPTLAGDRLINRSETRKAFAALEDTGTQVAVVHGIAGSGKSVVVYELARELKKQKIPFLPLRLDRHEPQGDPREFGISLGLPDSPASSLAILKGKRNAILVLDQLDALRWTSAHSGEAWEVCREVIKEAVEKQSGIQVVVCCRTFDLEHDPQLRGWERETRSLQRVEVGKLSEQDVTEAIQDASADKKDKVVLAPRESKLLLHVQHLQMWLEIYRTTREAPQFDTARALMDQFWANRLDELAAAGLEKDRSEGIFEELVKAMGDGVRLSAPLRTLQGTKRERDLLQ